MASLTAVSTNSSVPGYSFYKTRPTPITLDFFLKSQGANMFSFSTLLDEGVRVFLVNLNQPISLAAISSQSYAELLHPNSYFLSSIAPTYVGLYTGYSPWSSDGTYTGIYRDPLFGWARLVNNQGVIQLTTSALAYGAGGIFAGTQNIIQVPEPGALILTALGAVLIGLCSRKNSGRG